MLSGFNFGLKTFLLLIQGSPVYTTWNPWLLLTGIPLKSGGVAMQTLMRDICSHFLMVCSFESTWLGSNGWGCRLPYPDCASLWSWWHLLQHEPSPRGIWADAGPENFERVEMEQAERGTGVWTCKRPLAVNLEPNEEGRLWRAGRSSNNPDQASGQLPPSKNSEQTVWVGISLVSYLLICLFISPGLKKIF